MARKTLFLVVAALGASASMACSEGRSATAATRQDTAQGADDPVLAEVRGEAIRQSEVDEGLASELQSIEQQLYDLRRRALKEEIAKRLYDWEAERRGISVAALIEQEIDDKLQSASDEEIDRVYEANRSRLSDRTKKQVIPEIQMYLRRQQRAARVMEFRRELADIAEVRVILDPPRIAVNVPDGTPSMGPDDAPITMVAFSDYQCPYCHRAQATVEELLAKYEGKIRFVHRDYPLDFHKGALPAARAARCAGEQGRFWDFHRNLLARLTDFSTEDLTGRAGEMSLDMSEFEACFDSERYTKEIKASFAAGRAIGVTATPTFFINGRRLEGAKPLEEFQELIEEELAVSP